MATATNLPNLPTFNYVIDDSPSCHQSLKYWGGKSNEDCCQLIMHSSAIQFNFYKW